MTKEAILKFSSDFKNLPVEQQQQMIREAEGADLYLTIPHRHHKNKQGQITVETLTSENTLCSTGTTAEELEGKSIYPTSWVAAEQKKYYQPSEYSVIKPGTHFSISSSHIAKFLKEQPYSQDIGLARNTCTDLGSLNSDQVYYEDSITQNGQPVSITRIQKKEKKGASDRRSRFSFDSIVEGKLMAKETKDCGDYLHPEPEPPDSPPPKKPKTNK